MPLAASLEYTLNESGVRHPGDRVLLLLLLPLLLRGASSRAMFWAVTVAPMPHNAPAPNVLQTSCCTRLFYKHVLQTALGMGMGMNVTAQVYYCSMCISLYHLMYSMCACCTKCCIVVTTCHTPTHPVVIVAASTLALTDGRMAHTSEEWHIYIYI